jgi:hypothetical protein
MDIAAAIMLVLLVLVPAVVVIGLFVWAARKDGLEDRALPARPLVRLYGHDAGLLRREVRRVVLHEVAHHFGISDERLIEIDRY